jgi:valyl-tRNA synthetase
MEKSEPSKQYDRVAVEKKGKEFWEKEKIFQFVWDEKKPLFSVDTPPPYVSADHLHTGHIMSYSQAEFIVRYKRMRGFSVFYPMGFDDNGLPTERFVEKKYKIDKSKISPSEFVKICLKETAIGSQTYKKLWDNLGISVDWDKTYSTISPLATKVSQWSLIDLYKKGALYRKEAPVLWCPMCRTAIAQADLEDQEEKSQINYLNFKSADGKDLTVATTRPELLPACVALYVNPRDKRYRKLIGTTATVPLFDYTVPIRESEKVEIAFGTGLMMVCTWGDKDDLEKWQEDKLETRALVKEDGRLNEQGGKFAGLKIVQAREAIIAELQKKNLLIKQEPVEHTLNVHDRCGTPTEFILSQQWFIKIADQKKIWQEQGRKLNWYPQHKIKDYEMWVDSIKWDWCISRQRYFGVPFPVWYCAQCDKPIFAEEKDLPVNPRESQPRAGKCPYCKSTKFIPEKDVLDTWATSSCTPFLLREMVPEKSAKTALFPPTLRPNAFEIIRTWDFYSIVKSYYNFGSLPFKDLMISGHGLDEQGRKIAKRLGNYIPSDKLLEDYGADAIRYWATGATLGQNLRFNPPEVRKGKRTTIKLWNVARFIQMNLESFSLDSEEGKLETPDIWIIQELNQTIKKVTQAFDGYTYAKARDEVDEFFWSKLADYYIEFVKYRLAGKDETSRQAVQFTLTRVFLAVIKMYAPILPFVTEEIYQTMFRSWEGQKSLHLSRWPEPLAILSSEDVSDFNKAIEAVAEIRKYKSEKDLSLAVELEDYKLKTAVDLEKYGDFVKKVVRVKNLSQKK